MSGISKPENIIGNKYGRLTVVALHAVKPPRWLCECECGKWSIAHGSNLRTGKTKSCGCNQHPGTPITHGLTGSAEYKIWSGIKRRCLNPHEKAYPRYSKLGVCARWRDSFEAFLADMGNRPSPKHSIDRIDNERGYEPGNCRWATQSEQCRNTSKTKLTVERAAEIRSLVAAGGKQRDVAARYGISQRLVGMVVHGEIWND